MRVSSTASVLLRLMLSGLHKERLKSCFQYNCGCCGVRLRLICVHKKLGRVVSDDLLACTIAHRAIFLGRGHLRHVQRRCLMMPFLAEAGRRPATADSPKQILLSCCTCCDFASRKLQQLEHIFTSRAGVQGGFNAARGVFAVQDRHA